MIGKEGEAFMGELLREVSSGLREHDESSLWWGEYIKQKSWSCERAGGTGERQGFTTGGPDVGKRERGRAGVGAEEGCRDAGPQQ